jgi:hypothetical protein
MTNQRHFKGTRRNNKETTCDSVRRWQDKPNVAICTVAVTQHYACCYSFYLSRRNENLSRDCPLQGLNTDLNPVIENVGPGLVG